MGDCQESDSANMTLWVILPNMELVTYTHVLPYTNSYSGKENCKWLWLERDAFGF